MEKQKKTEVRSLLFQIKNETTKPVRSIVFQDEGFQFITEESIKALREIHELINTHIPEGIYSETVIFSLSRGQKLVLIQSLLGEKNQLRLPEPRYEDNLFPRVLTIRETMLHFLKKYANINKGNLLNDKGSFIGFLVTCNIIEIEMVLKEEYSRR